MAVDELAFGAVGGGGGPLGGCMCGGGGCDGGLGRGAGGPPAQGRAGGGEGWRRSLEELLTWGGGAFFQRPARLRERGRRKACCWASRPVRGRTVKTKFSKLTSTKGPFLPTNLKMRMRMRFHGPRMVKEVVILVIVGEERIQVVRVEVRMVDSTSELQEDHNDVARRGRRCSN